MKIVFTNGTINLDILDNTEVELLKQSWEDIKAKKPKIYFVSVKQKGAAAKPIAFGGYDEMYALQNALFAGLMEGIEVFDVAGWMERHKEQG